MKKQAKIAEKENKTELSYFDMNFDIDTDFETGVDLDTDFNFAENEENNRFIKPNQSKLVPASFVCYENAKKLALDMKHLKNERIYALLSGSFIYGDFIEAYIHEYNFKIKQLTIATLSLSKNNVDSLRNLLIWGNVEKLTLIISSYFYATERAKSIPYIYQNLDIENRFQLVVCQSHAKITQFETVNGNKCVIYGSANLRSSQCVEQITIEQNNNLYDFNDLYFNKIIEKYKTINTDIMISTSFYNNSSALRKFLNEINDDNIINPKNF